jgi:hypothetical protein
MLKTKHFVMGLGTNTGRICLQPKHFDNASLNFTLSTKGYFTITTQSNPTVDENPNSRVANDDKEGQPV